MFDQHERLAVSARRQIPLKPQSGLIEDRHVICIQIFDLADQIS